jgi:hypothetical protein
VHQLFVKRDISLTACRPTERLSATRKATAVLVLFTLIPVGVLRNLEIGLSSGAVTSQLPGKLSPSAQLVDQRGRPLCCAESAAA